MAEDQGKEGAVPASSECSHGKLLSTAPETNAARFAARSNAISGRILPQVQRSDSQSTPAAVASAAPTSVEPAAAATTLEGPNTPHPPPQASSPAEGFREYMKPVLGNTRKPRQRTEETTMVTPKENTTQLEEAPKSALAQGAAAKIQHDVEVRNLQMKLTDALNSLEKEKTAALKEKASYQTRESDYKNTIEQYRLTCQNLESKHHDTTELLKGLKNHYELAHQHLERKQRDNDQLVEKLQAGMNTLRAERENWELERKSVVVAQDAGQARLKEAVERAERLANQCEGLGQAQEQLDTARHERQKAEEKVGSLTMECHSWRLHAQGLNAQLGEANTRIQHLTTHVHHCTDHVRHLTAARGESQKEVEELKTSLASTRTLLNQANSHMAYWRKAAYLLKNQNQAYLGENNYYKTKNQDLTTKKLSLGVKNSSLKEKYSACKVRRNTRTG